MIGNNVSTICNQAFSGCTNLPSIELGPNIHSIGTEAFSDCTSIKEIVCKSDTPPTCRTHALDDINKWECKLIVPKGCAEAYKAADQWKDFFFIEETDYVPEDMPEPEDPEKK